MQTHDRAPLTVGSLFSGIGGFDLGLERTGGFKTAWFCEQDEFCQRVLAKHWPGVPCYPDICELRGPDVEHVDVLCGGFPCQDLSSAGKRAGITGERSGLWFEYLRTVREIRPRYVLVENVPGLKKYLDIVLRGLAEAGYDAEWDCIRASDFGAPHQRNRLWLVAYPSRDMQAGAAPTGTIRERIGARGPESRAACDVADAQGERGRSRAEARPRDKQGNQPCDRCSVVADTAECANFSGLPQSIQRSLSTGAQGARDSISWLTEPDVGRVADGVPARVDRLRALGNALVPQIAEWIGRRILDHESWRVT